MKAPAFAGSVDNVERLGVLKIQVLDLALKRVERAGREQFALDGAEDRKSGPSECVLDFTARVRFHVVLHLIPAAGAPASYGPRKSTGPRRLLQRLVRRASIPEPSPRLLAEEPG